MKKEENTSLADAKYLRNVQPTLLKCFQTPRLRAKKASNKICLISGITAVQICAKFRRRQNEKKESDAGGSDEVRPAGAVRRRAGALRRVRCCDARWPAACPFSAASKQMFFATKEPFCCTSRHLQDLRASCAPALDFM